MGAKAKFDPVEAARKLDHATIDALRQENVRLREEATKAVNRLVEQRDNLECALAAMLGAFDNPLADYDDKPTERIAIKMARAAIKAARPSLSPRP